MGPPPLSCGLPQKIELCCLAYWTILIKPTKMLEMVPSPPINKGTLPFTPDKPHKRFVSSIITTQIHQSDCLLIPPPGPDCCCIFTHPWKPRAPRGTSRTLGCFGLFRFSFSKTRPQPTPFFFVFRDDLRFYVWSKPSHCFMNFVTCYNPKNFSRL